MRTLFLVRHGETDWNREDRMQGRALTQLNDRGRRQARSTGRYLARHWELDALYTSPLPRAAETARIIGDQCRVDVTDRFHGLKERDWGGLQGFLSDDAFSEYPEISMSTSGTDAFEQAPPGGESYADVQERAIDAWRRIVDRTDEDEVAAVVSHGIPIRLIKGHVKGLTPAKGVKQEVSNAAVTVVRVNSEAAVVVEDDFQPFADAPREGEVLSE